jgi:hypothetical protein
VAKVASPLRERRQRELARRSGATYCPQAGKHRVVGDGLWGTGCDRVDGGLVQVASLASCLRLDPLAQPGRQLAGRLMIGCRGVTTNPTRHGSSGTTRHSAAAFAKLCGVCPMPASSGKTLRHRLNRGGNRQANAALYRVVTVRMRGHQPTLDYVPRRTAEGKSKSEIIRCLKRYVAREIFKYLCTKPVVAAAASTSS